MPPSPYSFPGELAPAPQGRRSRLALRDNYPLHGGRPLLRRTEQQLADIKSELADTRKDVAKLREQAAVNAFAALAVRMEKHLGIAG